ncbi:MAG TPA: PKD domain-containing protein [Candidatus Thermoplasmatota archaeon]|nr:PKD domain-containing protein [Candidatus Thermoplasmatota archaeon]
MRTLLAIASLAFLTVAFAGCAEDAERYPDGVPQSSTSRSSSATGSATTTSTGSSTGTSTGPSGNGTNQAPTANLTAAPLNGSSPLNVTFSIDGDDADGGNLTWSLALGDGNRTNGTSFPATFNHTYNQTGNFTAILTVSDDFTVGTASVVIQVQGGSGVPAVPPDQCDRVPTQAAGPFYLYSGDGGDWTFVEDNDIPGLQVANNHPGGDPFHNPAWVDCKNGDLQVF